MIHALGINAAEKKDAGRQLVPPYSVFIHKTTADRRGNTSGKGSSVARTKEAIGRVSPSSRRIPHAYGLRRSTSRRAKVQDT